MLTVAVLASSHNVKALDPIDKVTISTLKDYAQARENLKGGWVTHKFTPFDPVSKRITAEVSKRGRHYTCAKGAPNAILRLTNPSPQITELYRIKTQEFAKRGFRTLGVAVQEEGGPWQVLGLLPMFDPPRSDTAQTIAEARELGVRVKMLTGDAVAIAKETCRQLSLGQNVYDSARLMTGGMSGSEVRLSPHPAPVRAAHGMHRSCTTSSRAPTGSRKSRPSTSTRSSRCSSSAAILRL